MKLIRILFILLVFSITLSACTSAKLADKYDENIVTERAKKVVEMINSQDYDKVNAEIRHDLQDQLTSDKLKDAIGAKLVEAGAFIEYQSVYCEQNGNKLEIHTAADGSQNGVCVFPDGSTCDEWAYFRGECGPAAQKSPTPAMTVEATADSKRWHRKKMPQAVTCHQVPQKR